MCGFAGFVDALPKSSGEDPAVLARRAAERHHHRGTGDSGVRVGGSRSGCRYPGNDASVILRMIEEENEVYFLDCAEEAWHHIDTHDDLQIAKEEPIKMG